MIKQSIPRFGFKAARKRFYEFRVRLAAYRTRNVDNLTVIFESCGLFGLVRRQNLIKYHERRSDTQYDRIQEDVRH